MPGQRGRLDVPAATAGEAGCTSERKRNPKDKESAACSPVSIFSASQTLVTPRQGASHIRPIWPATPSTTRVSLFFIMDLPSQSTKRLLDTSLETPSLPAAKRARLFETNLQQHAPKRPRASFLKDHVGLTDTISEWLESIGSDREKRCRSDSYLHASSDDPISRNLTRSALQMTYNRGADGYAMPPTLNSYTGSFAPSIAPSDGTGATPGSSRSSRAPVKDPYYRD